MCHTPFSGIPYIRVTATLKGPRGEWSAPVALLLDTGASISLLPEDLLGTLGIDEWFEHEFYGVVNRAECKVPGKIAHLDIQLEDRDGHKSPAFPAMAAFTNIRPLTPLLGMKDCIERFSVLQDFQAGEARLNFT